MLGVLCLMRVWVAVMRAEELLKQGGPMEGFQLWVNLPAALKMVPPRWVRG